MEMETVKSWTTIKSQADQNIPRVMAIAFCLARLKDVKLIYISNITANYQQENAIYVYTSYAGMILEVGCGKKRQQITILPQPEIERSQLIDTVMAYLQSQSAYFDKRNIAIIEELSQATGKKNGQQRANCRVKQGNTAVLPEYRLAKDLPLIPLNPVSLRVIDPDDVEFERPQNPRPQHPQYSPHFKHSLYLGSARILYEQLWQLTDGYSPDAPSIVIKNYAWKLNRSLSHNQLPDWFVFTIMELIRLGVVEKITKNDILLHRVKIAKVKIKAPEKPSLPEPDSTDQDQDEQKEEVMPIQPDIDKAPEKKEKPKLNKVELMTYQALVEIYGRTPTKITGVTLGLEEWAAKHDVIPSRLKRGWAGLRKKGVAYSLMPSLKKPRAFGLQPLTSIIIPPESEIQEKTIKPQRNTILSEVLLRLAYHLQRAADDLRILAEHGKMAD